MKKVKNYKIIIPYQPDSFNQVYFGKNREVSDLKLRWEHRMTTVLENQVREHNLPYKIKGISEFFFKLYFETHRTRDADNYYLITKGIMDAFVTTNIIKDDSSKYALHNGMRVFIDPERPRIEVFIKNIYEEEQYISIANEEGNSYLDSIKNG